MNTSAITDDADHTFALAQVESLMDAAPGSPREQELLRWSELVETYERAKFLIEEPNLADRDLSVLPKRD